jgi:hypothetical protein
VQSKLDADQDVDIDHVAVDRAIRGELVPLTPAERIRAAQIMIEGGATLKSTATLLRASRSTVAAWRDADWIPGAKPTRRVRAKLVAACGSVRMYQKHRRRGEDCPRCRAANTEASRRYRATGSTIRQTTEGD